MSLWSVIRIGLSLGFLLIVVAIAVVTVVLPKATGSTPLTVLTSSMEPGLPPGSLLVIRPVAVEDIRIGDVITYQIASGEPAVITHRVIAITSSSADGLTFTLQGDNNSEADAAAITPAQIQGRLWYSLPLLGHASTALAGPYRVWAIPAAGGLLLIYAAWLIGSGLVTAVRSRRDGAGALGRGGSGSDMPRGSGSGGGGPGEVGSGGGGSRANAPGGGGPGGDRPGASAVGGDRPGASAVGGDGPGGDTLGRDRPPGEGAGGDGPPIEHASAEETLSNQRPTAG